jgi:hypothetical protein
MLHLLFFYNKYDNFSCNLAFIQIPVLCQTCPFEVWRSEFPIYFAATEHWVLSKPPLKSKWVRPPRTSTRFMAARINHTHVTPFTKETTTCPICKFNLLASFQSPKVINGMSSCTMSWTGIESMETALCQPCIPDSRVRIRSYCVFYSRCGQRLSGETCPTSRDISFPPGFFL